MQASKQPLHVIWEFAYYCITSVQQKTLHTTCHNMIAPYLQTITRNQASIVMMQALVVASNAGPRIMMSYAIKDPNMLLLSLRLKSANFCEVRFVIWHDHNCVTATTMLQPKLCTLWKVQTQCRDRRHIRGYQANKLGQKGQWFKKCWPKN